MFRKLIIRQIKSFKLQLIKTNSRVVPSDSKLARSFDDIPGPKSFPLIGTLYKYIPLIGEYSFLRLHKNGVKNYKSYGPLVREKIVPGMSIVWVFRPEDIAEVFKAEIGFHPERRSHLALLKYRMDRSQIYNNGGLLPTNGAEWWRIRREFQKAISKPQNVTAYLEDVDVIIQEFVKICEQEKTFTDLLPLLSRLFLELTCLVAFEERLNSLSDTERKDKNSRSSKLIAATFAVNSSIIKLDNGPRMWRYFQTPLYKKMCQAHGYMEKIAIELVSQKLHNLTAISEKKSIFEEYMNNPTLNVKDVIGMACDTILAGIDTTTFSIAFALYHLANNPGVQEKLMKEAETLIPRKDDPICPEVLKKATYTKAVIKESFRLNPISVGIGRILQNDAVLNGFNVPKGTVVVTQNQITCRLSEYFDDPDKFKPERWIREPKDQSILVEHPYLLLPFGHGPRSCIARRFAEQNMQVLLLRMCRGLSFKWKGRKLDCKSYLINKPDGPVKMNFYKKFS